MKTKIVMMFLLVGLMICTMGGCVRPNNGVMDQKEATQQAESTAELTEAGDAAVTEPTVQETEFAEETTEPDKTDPDEIEESVTQPSEKEEPVSTTPAATNPAATEPAGTESSGDDGHTMLPEDEL